MKSLAHWMGGWPLMAGVVMGTLAYYFARGAAKLARKREKAKSDDPATPKWALKRGPYPTLAIEPAYGEWCPIHCAWFEGVPGYEAETECPACLREALERRAALIAAEYGEDDWGLDDRVGLGPDGEGTDAWYRDLANRAESGWNGADPYRPEGGF